MLKKLRGCLGSIFTIAVLVFVAFAGWRYGDYFFPTALTVAGLDDSGVEALPEPSLEIAERSLVRYEALLNSESGATQAFSALEVTSMIRYSFPGMIPEGLGDPSVEIEDGSLRLHARVARAAFPTFPRLEGVMEILPDTVPLTVEGALLPFDPAHVSVVVESIDASAIPVPRRFFPAILDAVGRRARAGLPPNAVAIPLPDGLSGAYVEGGSLVFVAAG